MTAGMAVDRIKVLTTLHQIKPTPTRHHSIWPNDGRCSSCRGGIYSDNPDPAEIGQPQWKQDVAGKVVIIHGVVMTLTDKQETTPSIRHLVHPKYREDIDGLRAIAVLSVVAFHAFPGRVPGGFIGVDVFFVISGFLISTILFENLQQGRFSFSEFYARRIRRIFPALILILASTMAAGWALLFTDEFQQICKHVAAGAGFVSNLVLWGESGYFDTSAKAKPLLHLWSLGIEEQFYIVWPLVVYIGWRLRANFLALSAIIALISFIINVAERHADPTAIFYSPQTRFWELLIGTILAASYAKISEFLGRRGRLANIASAVGLVLLVAGLRFITEEKTFPGFWGLIPTTGTALLISSGRSATLNRFVLRQPLMVWFGLISYPLYLWHWPILSYLNIVFGTPTALMKVAAVALAVGLAWATVQLIESRVRYKQSNYSIALLVGLNTGIFLLAISLNIFEIQTRIGFGGPPIETRNNIIKQYISNDYNSCRVVAGVTPLDYEQCKSNSSAPEYLFIGDSHAAAVYDGIIRDKIAYKSMLIAGGGCKMYPSLTYRPIFSHVWGKNCTAIAMHAAAIASQLSSISTIIVIQEERLLGEQYFDEHGIPIDKNEDVILSGTTGLLDQLSRSGKAVIYLKDVPRFRKAPMECRKRFLSDADTECRIERVEFNDSRVTYNNAINELSAKFPSVTFVDPTDIFCDTKYCYNKNKNGYLYNDEHHLSSYGALLVIDEIFGRR